jgi:hypothetical protein
MIMVLEKINPDKIDATLERVLEMSSNVRVLQEDMENINKNLKDVNFDYLAGKISKEVYEGSKKDLGKRRKIIIDRINKAVGDILSVSSDLPEIIKNSKL